MKKRLFLCFICFLALPLIALGQSVTTIKGTVTDSITGEALPYVSLILKETTTGAATDIDGTFSFTTSSNSSKILEVSYLGYTTKNIQIQLGRTNNLDIKLAPTGIELNEVVVKPGHEHYSRRNNPAVDFVRKVIELRDANDPFNHDYYSYDKYQRMVFAMNEYQPKEHKDGKTGRFDFLVDFIDTLDAGTTILPLSEREHLETVYYRREPKSEKHLVRGHKSAGVDEIFSRDGIQQFLDEAFKEVDIFQNNIPLFLQRFVSPLSSIGPTFYRYYLLDTLEIEGQQCMDLGFAPFNSESFGFTGHLYVTLDSTYFVRHVHLNVPKDINLNFVSHMSIEQTFRREPDGTRIITKDDIQVNFKLTEKSKGMYAQRLIIYSNHSFDIPNTHELSIFEQSAPSISAKNAYSQTEKFWEDNRPKEGQRRNPNSVDKMMQKLRSIPIFYATEKIVSVLVSGYVPVIKNEEQNKFEFGPMNTTISGNAIEGARLRVGGTTTPVFHKRWTLDGFAAYGFRDQKMKYDALVEYSFIDRKQYRKEYPVHSLRLEYMYDINKLGQQYMYTSKDNFLLSIRRKRDTRATYLRKAELTYTREHYNGISYSAAIRNKREYATPYAVFERINADGTQTPLGHYDMSEMELNFRYAKGEKFYQTRNTRIPITFDALIFNVSHIMAWKNVLGSDYNYQRTDVGIQKRFWFSAFGYTDIILKGGKVWSKVPYPLLILPNANLSYTIQPEAYTNMNAMEFLNDEYLSWDVTYYLNGNLLNRIPLIKKLKWREVFTFRGLWGHLTDKNNPAINGEGLYAFPEGSLTMNKEPYMEAGVGIENIFKFLRLDYVWRLNYLDNPNIQKHGIRATMRISF